MKIRTENSIKNVFMAIFSQMITVLMTFISRTIFINVLGVEYLGLNGLFTNIITILNVSELGIGTAIIYSLYKPLKEKDENKIILIMKLLKKAYFVIGLIVLIIGIMLIPLLPFIIKEGKELVDINLIYGLYLFQTVSTYWFFAYKATIITADQRQYHISKINYIITTIMTILQLLILYLFKSYVGYLIIGIMFNIIKNFLISRKANKIYPYLKNKSIGKLDKKDKNEIVKNTFGLSMYKISSIVLNSTDNIIISIFIGLIEVGKYSNYLMILNAVTGFTKLIFNSLTASIGNMYISEKEEKSEFIFRCINFLNFWVYGFCAIALFVAINPFIEIWVGDEYLFNICIVSLIVLNFVTSGLQDAVINFKDACGLFWKGKLRPALSAILNVIISVILVRFMGIAGVILGTIISRFLTTWWFDALLVYKNAFKMSPRKYYVRYMKKLLLIIVVGIITSLICYPFKDGGIINFIIICAICCIIPNMIFFILYRKNEEFLYLKGLLETNIIDKMKNKNREKN